MRAACCVCLASADDKEKVLVKPEPNDKADETMPDAPQERRLPPKKMKLLEERNGGPAAGSPDALKCVS